MDLSVTVTIDGSDYSSEVVSIERHHSICETMATGTIELGPGATVPDPYDPVVVYEQGVKVFTGYVTNVGRGRLPLSHSVEIADPAIKLADYWLTETYTCSGESAEFWIGFFCDLAGVSYQFDETYDLTLPYEYEWEYASALSIVEQLLVIGGFFMYSDANGLLHFGNETIGVGPAAISTGTNLLSMQRQQSITPTRNRAIVFGKYPIVAEVTTTVDELPAGVTKTAVVASPYIEASGYAATLADRMLDHFAQPMNAKVAEVEGNPSYRPGQTVAITENWTGATSGGSLIITLDSQMGNSGYTMTMLLDEFCPKIWGWAPASGVLTLPVSLYCTTAGAGVYRTDDLGLNWTNVTGNLSGSGLYARGVSANGNDAWVATAAGVYYSSTKGTTWSDMTPSNIPSGVTMPDWTDIEIDPNDTDIIYALLWDMTNSRVYLYKTANKGSSWTYKRVDGA